MLNLYLKFKERNLTSLEVVPYSPVKEGNTGFFLNLTMVEHDTFGVPTNKQYANITIDTLDRMIADVDTRITATNASYSAVLASLYEEKDNYLTLKKDFSEACEAHVFEYKTQAEYNKTIVVSQ